MYVMIIFWSYTLMMYFSIKLHSTWWKINIGDFYQNFFVRGSEKYICSTLCVNWRIQQRKCILKKNRCKGFCIWHWCCFDSLPNIKNTDEKQSLSTLSDLRYRVWPNKVNELDVYLQLFLELQFSNFW